MLYQGICIWSLPKFFMFKRLVLPFYFLNFQGAWNVRGIRLIDPEVHS